MHAAASYGHIDVLEYLVSKGGDVNITDEDHETPLYTVESVTVARWLVDHGARVDIKNLEGISPIEHLTEEFPEASQYLRSTLSQAATTTAQESSSSQPSNPTSSIPQPSTYVTEQSADQLTSELLQRVEDIMQRSEAEGRDPDEELRQAVGETVLEGMLQGVRLGDDASSFPDEEVTTGQPRRANGVENTETNGAGAKRSRTDG